MRASFYGGPFDGKELVMSNFISEGTVLIVRPPTDIEKMRISLASPDRKPEFSIIPKDAAYTALRADYANNIQRFEFKEMV